MAWIPAVFASVAIPVTLAGLIWAISLRVRGRVRRHQAGIGWWLLILFVTLFGAGDLAFGFAGWDDQTDPWGGQAALDRSKVAVVAEVDRTIADALSGIRMRGGWSEYSPTHCGVHRDFMYESYRAESERMNIAEAGAAAQEVVDYWIEVYGDRVDRTPPYGSAWASVDLVEGQLNVYRLRASGSADRWHVVIGATTRCVAVPSVLGMLIGIPGIWIGSVLLLGRKTWRASRPRPVEKTDEAV